MMPIGRNRPRRWEGGASMKTAAEYRAMAEECVKWGAKPIRTKYGSHFCNSRKFGWTPLLKLMACPQTG